MDSSLTQEQVDTFMDVSPDALVVINKTGLIIMSNNQADALFGRTHDQMVGSLIDTLLPERFRSKHAQHRYRYFLSPQARPMGTGLQLFGCRDGNREFPVDISLRPILLLGIIHAIAAIRDMSGTYDMIQRQTVTPLTRLIERVDNIEGRMDIYEGKLTEMGIQITEVSNATKANAIILENIEVSMKSLEAIEKGVHGLKTFFKQVVLWTLTALGSITIIVVAALIISRLIPH